MNWQQCNSCEEEFMIEVVGIKTAAYCPVCGDPLSDPNGEILQEDYDYIEENE